MKFTPLLKKPANYILLAIAILGLILFILVNQLIFVPLTQMVPTYGILDFEFAWTPERVLLIFSAWGVPGIEAQTIGIYWDFLYILAYSSFIFSCILLVTRGLTGRFQAVGLWMSLTPIISGIFDVIENINLLIMLNTTPNLSVFVSFLASLSACIKFGLLFIGIAFFFVALIAFIITLIKKRKN